MDHKEKKSEVNSIASSSSSSERKVDLLAPSSPDTKEDVKHSTTKEQDYMFDKMGMAEANEYELPEQTNEIEPESTKPKTSLYVRYRKFFQ
jgi:hypothetical protein